MVNNIFAFKKKFFKFDNVKDFHYTLTNIVYLGRECDESWSCYGDYRFCYFIKKKSHLCSFCSKLFERKLIDNMSAREVLQRNYDNEVKLRPFAELISPFFKKMFFL